MLRTAVKPNCKLYDEQGTPTSIDSLTPANYIASILEIQGIRFTSRNFQLEIEMKQAMLVNPDPFVDACFIRPRVPKPPPSNLDDDVFDKALAVVVAAKHDDGDAVKHDDGDAVKHDDDAVMHDDDDDAVKHNNGHAGYYEEMH